MEGEWKGGGGARSRGGRRGFGNVRCFDVYNGVPKGFGPGFLFSIYIKHLTWAKVEYHVCQ